MNFLWPQYLWLMLALPLLPALYLWLLRRRGKPALRYSNLDVVRAASEPPVAAARAARTAPARLFAAAVGRRAPARRR